MDKTASKKISLFYRVLLAVSLVLLLAFFYVRFGMLRPWLTRYEAAQPKHACQEIFQDLFAPAEGGPDWGRVYDLARLEDTAYRGREQFIRAMEDLTAGQALTYVETSAGLSGDRRYLVKSGGDSIAAFTLTNRGDGESADWQLSALEMLLGRTGTVTVRTHSELHRVYVNGVQLTAGSQVQTIDTMAQRYLPEGVHGPWTIVWQTECGFTQQAEVQVLNVSNEEVPLVYHAEGDYFEEAEALPEISEEERALAIGAAETYAKFMIRAADAAQLRRYFDSNSQIYRTIRGSEIWMQQNNGYSFTDEAVSQYCRYNQNVFSVRVSLVLNVARSNGTRKPYALDSTFFFQRKDNSCLVFEMTNMDVQAEGIVCSRLRFMNGEELVQQLYVSSDETDLTFPVVSAPPGQAFAGWAIREQSGDSVTMTILFQPGEDGALELPENAIRQPMTLYAVFE